MLAEEALESKPRFERLTEFKLGALVWYWYRYAPDPVALPSMSDTLMILDVFPSVFHEYRDVNVLKSDGIVVTLYNCAADDFVAASP